MFNDLAAPARRSYLARHRWNRRAHTYGLPIVLAITLFCAFLITSAHADALIANL